MGIKSGFIRSKWLWHLASNCAQTLECYIKETLDYIKIEMLIPLLCSGWEIISELLRADNLLNLARTDFNVEKNRKLIVVTAQIMSRCGVTSQTFIYQIFELTHKHYAELSYRLTASATAYEFNRDLSRREHMSHSFRLKQLRKLCLISNHIGITSPQHNSFYCKLGRHYSTQQLSQWWNM